MNAWYQIVRGVPIPPPPPLGRKKGSHDNLHVARQAAITNGVVLRRSGETLLVAARAVLSEHSWWSISPEHLARLISIASKRPDDIQERLALKGHL